jgi:C4-dicarboxylate-binding protein DctP
VKTNIQNMTKTLKYITAGAVIGAATFMSLPGTASAETMIRITMQLPDNHFATTNWKDFGKIITEKSGGELKTQIFPSAQLFKDNEVPGAVGSGAVEAGSTFIGRFAGSVPAVDVISIPFIFKNEAHLRKVVAPGSDLRKTIDAAILKETNNKVLWWQAFGRNIYLNNGGPIIAPSDLKGKKVRTYGKMQGWTVEALGGSPTLMSGSKQFLAYQQKAVDVGMTGVSTIKSRKLYEVMEHATLTHDSAIEFIAVMNNDFYNKLSDNHKEIINAAALEVEAKLRDEVYKTEDTITEEMKSKINIVQLTAAQRAEWSKALVGIEERFVKESGPTGAAALAAIKSAM